MRHSAVQILAGVVLWHSSALAQVVIEIPDLPVFIFDQPIVTADPVLVSAGAGTDLIFDASITAPSVEIDTGGDVTLGSDFNITAGTFGISAGGEITVDDGVSINVVEPVTFTAGIVGLPPNGAPQTPPQAPPRPPVALLRDGNLIIPAGRGAAVVTDFRDEPVGILPIRIDNARAVQALAGMAFAETQVTGLGAIDMAAEFGRSARFVEQLFSCPSRDGSPAPSAQETCVWGGGGVSMYKFDDGSLAAFDELLYSFTAGAQVVFDDDIILGGAIGYDSVTLYDGLTGTFSDRVRAGVVMKYMSDGANAGLAFAAAAGPLDTARRTPTGLAIGKSETLSVSARAQIGYTAKAGPLYLNPSVGAAFTYSRSRAFNETGADINNRVVSDADAMTVSAHPQIEVGATLRLGEFDTTVRPRMRLGVDWYANPEFSTTAELAGAIPLVEQVELDKLLGVFELAVSVWAYDDVMIDLGYQGQSGSNTRSHGGSVRLNFSF